MTKEETWLKHLNLRVPNKDLQTIDTDIYHAIMDAMEEHKTQSKPIDQVTVTNLDLALRMCEIKVAKPILDRIIDLVELLEIKGDNVSIMDVILLENEWISAGKK